VLALLAGASLYLYGRGRSAPPGQTAFEGATMGTTYRVVLGRPQPAPALAALQRLVDERLAALEARMSTYDAGSELSRFNAHASTDPFPVSEELAAVIAMAQEVSRASDGAFDVTVGPLVDAWGFGPAPRPTKALDDAALAALRERVGYEKLELRDGALVKHHPALRVDLSAIAKGHGVDVVAELLEAQGHTDYLVEIGGELRGRGRNAEGRRFRVGIEDPVVETRAVHTRIELEGALATSGNYRNHFDLDGQRLAHTIDPRTGRPVQHALLSASVLHDRCALADAWATALMAAGPDRAWSLAQERGLDVMLLVSAPPGGAAAVERRLTPGFARRELTVPNQPNARNDQPETRTAP
jgi:thiamine biosynthesis lipoprotein